MTVGYNKAVYITQQKYATYIYTKSNLRRLKIRIYSHLSTTLSKQFLQSFFIFCEKNSNTSMKRENVLFLKKEGCLALPTCYIQFNCTDHFTYMLYSILYEL